MIYTSKAKQLLSENIHNKVIEHCEATDHNKEDAFRDILVNGVKGYCKHQTNDLEDVLMSDNQVLVDYIVDGMKKPFDELAIQFGYTLYSKSEEQTTSSTVHRNRKR